MAFSFSPKIVTNGLVLYLDAANTRSYPRSGNTWFDLSGNNNHGTLTNGPTFNNGNNGSIVFDGVNDYADFQNNTIGNGPNVTLECWFRTTTTLPRTHLLAKGNSGQYQYALRFGFNDPTLVTVVAWQAGSSNYSSAGSIGIVANNGNWYQVVGVIREGVGTFLYINGVLNNSNFSLSGTYNKNGTASLRVASRQDGADHFPGNIANVKIYNRALSATEILQNYNATKGRYGL